MKEIIKVNRQSLLILLSALLLPCFVFSAPSAITSKEVHSNGRGGGSWSESATWHDGAVPGPGDRVVITAFDKVMYDGGVAESPDCAGLYIDPDGLLTFSLDGRHHQLAVAGPVEAYGAIRADATRASDAHATLLLAATNDAERVLQVRRGGSLLFYGAADAPAGPNLTIQGATNLPPGLIEGQGDVMFDLHHTRVDGLRVQLSDVDNTGYRPRQRLNIIGNLFTRGSSIALSRCDTAVIKENTFDATHSPVNDPAVRLTHCTLTACHDNRFHGYSIAIDASHDVDVALQNNEISAATTAGLVLRSANNAMIKGNRLRDCVMGLMAEKSSGVVEGLHLERVKNGVLLSDSTLQMTDVNWVDNPNEARLLELKDSTSVLLNCNISAADIVLTGSRPPGKFWVQSMAYLVAHVTGKLPDRAVIQVATAKVSGSVPEGTADLNVRNAPARLSAQGWTPLPHTLRPIILRSWHISTDKKVHDAPFYDLAVMPLVDDPDTAPQALQRQVVEPRDSWFRAEPNAPIATFEVNIP